LKEQNNLALPWGTKTQKDITTKDNWQYPYYI
jgi:hypothetical protein